MGCRVARTGYGLGVGEALRDAVAQDWPPFVLVAGLLAIGAVAGADGLFEAE